jgi:hypothetical protein
LRTQFGQEVNKIEKSTTLGEDLIYKPKIWWFKELEWIGDYMKTRLDPSTPLSVRTKTIKPDKNDDPLFEFEEDAEDSEQYATIEFTEYDTETNDGEPAVKRQKTYQTPKAIRAAQKQEQPAVQTIEYTLINDDDTTEDPIKETPQFVEFTEADTDRNQDKFKRRSKAFGKFMASLLMEITDDNIFFDLQRNITNSIQEATIKQQQVRKK